MASYKINNEYNSIELYFDSIPNVSLRQELKAQGFKWHNMKKCWYAGCNDDRMRVAFALCGESNDFNKQDSTYNAQVLTDSVNEQMSVGFSSDRMDCKRRDSANPSAREKDGKEYKTKESIVSLIRPNNKMLQLNKMELENGEYFYDIREWKNGTMGKGISLSEGELKELLLAIYQEKHYEKKIEEEELFHRNDEIYKNDLFNVTYLGYCEEQDRYCFEFVVENTSDRYISVHISPVFICDCEIDSYWDLKYDVIRPHKKKKGYIEISKKELKKNLIKKIWDYSKIEIEMSYYTHEGVKDTDFGEDNENITDLIKLAPDMIIRQYV